MKPYSNEKLEEIEFNILDDINIELQRNKNIRNGEGLICVQLDIIARLLVSIHLKLNEGE